MTAVVVTFFSMASREVATRAAATVVVVIIVISTRALSGINLALFAPSTIGMSLGFGLLLGFLAPFPLHSTVLKPDLDLSLRETKSRGHFKSLGS